MFLGSHASDLLTSPIVSIRIAPPFEHSFNVVVNPGYFFFFHLIDQLILGWVLTFLILLPISEGLFMVWDLKTYSWIPLRRERSDLLYILYEPQDYHYVEGPGENTRSKKALSQKAPKPISSSLCLSLRNQCPKLTSILSRYRVIGQETNLIGQKLQRTLQEGFKFLFISEDNLHQRS